MSNISPLSINKTGNIGNQKIVPKDIKDEASDNIKKRLGKDAFLKLLVAELRHQDPTRPMNDREFISQMAQFSALEQMTMMNKSIQNLITSARSKEAYSLLGKRVEALNPITKERITGIVSRIFYNENNIRISVNNKEIGLSDIHAIYPSEITKGITNQKSSLYDKDYIYKNNTTKDIKINNDIYK